MTYRGGACAPALSRTKSDPFDRPHGGVGQQTFETVLNFQCSEDANECVQRNPLSFLQPSYGSIRDAGFLGELLLRHISGKPYALQSLAQGGLYLITCCYREIDDIGHLLPVKLLF